MKLFYNKPPSKMRLKRPYFKGFENIWEQTSLPLGNGSIGMGVIGNIKSDTIVLNHKTLWAGGPSPKRPDYCGGNITTPDKDGKLPVDYYKEIYTAFKNGDDKLAHDLCEKLVGIMDGYGGYRCWGTFDFDFSCIRNEHNYHRELDMSNGVCSVFYDAKKGFTKKLHDDRTAFVSYPDKCGVIRIKRTGEKLNTEIKLSSAHGTVKYENDRIVHSGELEDNALKFCLIANVFTDGNAVATAKSMKISDATEMTIIFSADTDYMDIYPAYRTGENADALYNRVNETVIKATEKGYDALLKSHTEDFNEIMKRVSIDLDGAKDATQQNKEIFIDVAKNTGLKVEVGGGIRTLDTVEMYLNAGISRVIIGSAAVKNPQLVKDAVKEYGDRIAVGIDAKNGYVATEGWLETSDVHFTDLAKAMSDIGVKYIIFTDISKDGTLSGVNSEQLKQINEACSANIIASGGVHTIDDIITCKNLNLYGTICGKSIYSGTLDLREAIKESK